MNPFASHSGRGIVTIDGPAGAGKSTISRLLAERLSYLYLDTGALYRAVAYRLLQKGVPEKEEAMVALCSDMKVALERIEGRLHVLVDGQDVTDKIRTEEIGLLASRVSSLALVRKALLDIQRNIAESGGVVAEGRDMGSVVFPHALFKFYLDASVQERAVRRYRELTDRGVQANLDEVKKDIERRDHQDTSRDVSPLRIPTDAVVIDSTDKSIAQIVDIMMTSIHSPQQIQE